MDAIDIAIIGILAILLLYFAFGLLILETGKAYRDIRLAMVIRNEAVHTLPIARRRAENAPGTAPANRVPLLAPRERHPWEFGDITTQRIAR